MAIETIENDNSNNNPDNNLYDFTLDGDWNDNDKSIIQEAIYDIAIAFAQITTLTPVTIYNSVFGNLTFKLSGSLKYYGFVEDKNFISFKPNKITKYIVVHEMGHLFYLRIPQPIEILSKTGIYSPSNKFLTGLHPYGYYYRNNGKSAPKNGYVSDWYIDGYQLHPVTLPDGNNVDEDWADLFRNWVYNSFVENEAGITLYNWVNDHMTLWLNEYSELKDAE
ncbi:MAG TPA: hypothetical protein DDY71_05610 [Spirochaetia bacterium]|nr:hypothetical protein [Spirochaetia bacterium]